MCSDNSKYRILIRFHSVVSALAVAHDPAREGVLHPRAPVVLGGRGLAPVREPVREPALEAVTDARLQSRFLGHWAVQ